MESAINQSTYPEGWDKRKLFVDTEGNAYQFGAPKPELKGQFPVTSVKKDGQIIYPPASQTSPTPPVDLGETQPANSTAELLAKDSGVKLLDDLSKMESPIVEQKKEKKVEEKDQSAEVIDMLKNQNQDLMTRLSNMEKILMSGNLGATVNVKEEKKRFGEKDTSTMTPDDFSPEKKTYHMYGRGYVMGSYNTREGMVVMAPYNTSLYFKKSFDDIRHMDGTDRVIPFCSYSTHSKNEMAFIEGHPLYGIIIHSEVENAKGATSGDNVAKLESIITRIHSLDKMTLFSLAHQYQIDPNMDVNEIKNKIVWIEVKKELESEKSQQALRLTEIEREKKVYQ